MEELEPEVKELAEFTREFNSETDRGAALTAATYLDERLNEILNEYLADVDATKELLSGFNAPLSTFSARTKACYSLGLIQENEYSELNIPVYLWLLSDNVELIYEKIDYFKQQLLPLINLFL